MKKFLLSSLFVAILATASIAQRLPQPSPGASVMQTIGVTDVTIKYSRPSLKGRAVFPTILKYGEFWRTGANQATNIEFSTDVMFGGQKVAAGKYFLYSMPGENEWQIIINKSAATSAEAYKMADDVVRVAVKPTALGSAIETMTIGFSKLTDSSAHMEISWDKFSLATPIMVDTKANAEANVNKALAEKPEDPAVLQTAANFAMNQGKMDQALSLADKAIGVKETFRNVWLKAQILGKLGKFTDALPLAQKALSLGQASGDSGFPFMKTAIESGISDFTSKIPALPVSVPGMKKKKG